MRPSRALAPLLLAALLTGCATVGGPTAVSRRSDATVEVGFASYYGREFQGRRTANGERYDATELTAAHRSLPFGTLLRITHLGNGREVVLRVNDRGPHVRGRLVDVSLRAARELGFVRDGLARVRVEVLDEVATAP